MSWSDDTRCLFCDGKLPLFRKLAQGQFCSKAHQDAYWKEQDQLAVEVLHRTHDALQAYKPAASIESILGPSVAPPPVEVPYVAEPYREIPDLQGLQPQSASSQAIPPPASIIIAADPLEYEVQWRATKPHSVSESKAIRRFETLAGMVAIGSAKASVPGLLPVPASLAILDAQLSVNSPSLMFCASPNLALGGLVALREIAPGGAVDLECAAQPLEFSVAPVRELVHTLTPCGDVLERMEQEAFPLSETLLALSAPSVVNTRAQVRNTSDFVKFPETVVNRPWTMEVASQPVALAAAAGMFALTGTVAARNSHVNPMGEAVSIQPSAGPAQLSSLRMVPVATQLMADPTGYAPLLSLAPGKVRGGSENPANRPVSYQPFVAEGSLRLPDSAKRRVAAASLEIRTQARQVFRLNLVDKITPRADLRLRPGFVAAPLQGEAILPKAKLQPASPKYRSDGTPVLDGAILNAESHSPRKMAAGVVNFWNQAPRDLKILLFAVPVALGLAFHPSLPKVSVQAPQTDAKAVTGQFKEVLNTQVANLRKSMAERAAVGLDENFRSGLDNWMSHSGSTAEWSFDQAGFVQPGRVALYQPSLGLTDYEFQFLGAIDKGALSWVARAVDFQNYYVVKLVVAKGGPVPQMAITRYAVINGQPVDRVDTPVTFAARTDSLYRVSMVMEGDHYSLVIQGQMIDSWDEPRLKRGGVGFFTNRGEESRIGWVQITHQYDMLGRLFAYLAP